MQVRKQQLELDMEQQTGSKQEKEYDKAVYWGVGVGQGGLACCSSWGRKESDTIVTELISGLSHSIVFLYFFALITEEDLLFFRILWNSAFK